jgi:TldD protein
MLEKIKFPTVGYSDVRIEDVFETKIQFKNGDLLSAQSIQSMGAFIRLYQGHKWFYHATTDVENLQTVMDDFSLEVKEFSSEKTTPFPSRKNSQFKERRYSHLSSKNISLEIKKNLCEKLYHLSKQFPEIKDLMIVYKDQYKVKHFKSSDSVEFDYDYNQAGLSVSYELEREGKVFSDRFISFFHDFRNKESEIGTQFIENIKESLRFLEADSVTPGDYPVILSPIVTGVFTHESFGHKSEADFMIGDEKMIKEWAIGTKVASEMVSIVDEGMSFMSTGYCPIDDEGNIKKKTYLITKGILTGRLHSSTTAMALEEENTGNARGMNFEFEPIVRMTNTYIENGHQSLEELIRPIKKGLYIKDFYHGSGLSTFTIAPSKCYLIVDGKISDPIKVAVISGSVFETLNNIEGIANDFTVYSSALGGCGKNDQWPLPVADGGPSILVSKMQVS